MSERLDGRLVHGGPAARFGVEAFFFRELLRHFLSLKGRDYPHVLMSEVIPQHVLHSWNVIDDENARHPIAVTRCVGARRS
jgi:hypothetical protein